MLRRNFTRLAFESLENRSMLAGNVTAFVQDGNLFVNGDGFENRISIESAGAGIVQVRGFNDSSGIATSVNGSPNDLQTFAVSGSIIVRMNGGNDLVRITNLVASANVTVNMGEGNDELLLGRGAATSDVRFASTPSGPLYVQGELRVFGLGGNDLVFQSDLHVQGVSAVNLGDGDDRLQIQRPLNSTANVEYSSDLYILPGAGIDNVNIVGLVLFSGSMIVDDAGGALTFNVNSADIHGNLNIFSDEGADNISTLNTHVYGNMLVTTDGGNDVVSLSNIATRATVDTGDGNDDLHISSANISRLDLFLGLGADELDILSAHTNTIFAFGGDGNDVFLVRNTRAIDAFFNGEANFDTFRQSSALPNAITNLELISIESRQTV